jgi:hypothetical protein
MKEVNNGKLFRWSAIIARLEFGVTEKLLHTFAFTHSLSIIVWHNGCANRMREFADF